MTDQQYATGGNVHAPTARITILDPSNRGSFHMILWTLGLISGAFAGGIYTLVFTTHLGSQTVYYVAAGIIATALLALAIYLFIKYR